jgi:ABC-type sulfate/molybdate transport systems ATPase subunit
MTAGGIELRGLAKAYGRVRAVRDVSITIEAGQTVALLGPNGAGKSTTIDMMLGLARPDRGEVRVFGHSPEAAVDAGIVGAMLQVGQLIRDLNGRELVAMVASLYPDPLDIDEVLALTGTTDVAGRRTQKLSGARRSGCASRRRSSPTPACSCSTSRPWPWTWKAGTTSGRRCGSSRRGGRRSCSPRTTWKRRTPTPTASC